MTKLATIFCEISAPLDLVWAILTDVSQYSDWNPFVTNIEASTAVPAINTEMLFSVCFPDSDMITKTYETVTVFEPPHKSANGREAIWAYRYSSFPAQIGMIRANRVQKLTQLSPDKTAYFSEEVFTGWGKMFVPLDRVQAGFEVQARALKLYAEANRSD